MPPQIDSRIPQEKPYPTKKNRSAPKPPDNIEVKAIQLQEDDSSKTALIRTGLSDK